MDKTAHFDYVEYIAFILMLSLSGLIGLYFGCIKGGQNTVSGYLLGGKQMTVFPIIMSLVSTYISGITLLGLPTEIYLFGTQYILSFIPTIVGVIFNVFAILPVFYNLQLISLYEYMEMRFNNTVRLIISFMFVLSWLLYVPTVIYGPGLALNQVSGMNVHIVTPIVSIVCIMYTTLGGLKAVVWSDTLQATVMLGSVLSVIYLGIMDVGGLSNVFRFASEGDRLEFFNMDLRPTTRISLWSASLGTFFNTLLNVSCSPTVVQRYISLPSLKQARKSSIGLCVGSLTFLLLSSFTGLVIYAKYKDCDPLTAQMISKPDQILPLFVIDIASKIRGLAGLFMAGIVCAALSTMSTGLNTLSGTIYEDFIEPNLPKKPNERNASLILKFLVVMIGVIAVTLVALIEKLGQIVEMSQGFAGMTNGAMQGIFLLGLFVPFANTTGALTGGIVSLMIMTWFTIGNVLANTNGLIKHTTKPMSTALCSNFTEIITNSTVPAQIVTSSIPEYFPFYKLTVFYFSLIGCILVILIGIPVSLLTGGNKNEVDTKLLSPLAAYFYKRKEKYNYSSVQLKSNEFTKRSY